MKTALGPNSARFSHLQEQIKSANYTIGRRIDHQSTPFLLRNELFLRTALLLALVGVGQPWIGCKQGSQPLQLEQHAVDAALQLVRL